MKGKTWIKILDSVALVVGGVNVAMGLLQDYPGNAIAGALLIAVAMWKVEK